MSTRGIRAGKAFVEIGGDTSRLERALKRAQARLRAFGNSLKTIGLRVAAIGAGIVAALLAAARHFAQAGDRIDKMSKRVGVGVQALQELGFAAEQNGASLEVLEKGFAGLSRTFFEAMRGSSMAIDALDAIGIRFQHLQGLSPEDQFMLIAQALEAITDESIRGAVAQKIFGRAGRELLPMLRGAKGGIAALRAQFRNSGAAMSEDDIASAARLTDAWNLLRHALLSIVNTIGAAVAPTLTGAAERLTMVASAVTAWINQNRALVVMLLKVGTVIAVVGSAITLAGFAAIGMAAALGAVLSVMALLASPMVALIANVAFLGASIVHNTRWGGEALAWLMARFRELHAQVSRVLQGIADAIMAGNLDLAFRIMWLSAEVAFRAGTNVLLDIFDDFVHKIHSMWVDLGTRILNSDWFDNIRVAIGLDRQHIKAPQMPQRNTTASDRRAAELEDAQRQLTEAIQEAARQRLEGAGPTGIPRLGDFNFGETSSRVVGTFNARAAQGLAGSPTEDRIAKATEETARGIKTLNSRASSGGLVLGP